VERRAGVKLHKVVNREYRGKTYYRWILMVPPKVVGELGWREGEEIAMEVRGRALKVEPVEKDSTPSRGLSKRSG
jgi:hypothetical protein